MTQVLLTLIHIVMIDYWWAAMCGLIFPFSIPMPAISRFLDEWF